MMTRNKRNGFTLVELLVVIAIIGVLVALLLPAVQAAREAARRVSCVNNMTQLILAVQSYDAGFQAYPPGTVNPTGPIAELPQGYHHNWLTQLLPYIEEHNTYDHVDFTVGVYDPKNTEVRKVQLPIVQCPSEPMVGDVPMASYAGLHNDLDEPIDVNNRGIFFLNSAVKYEDVRDGTSQTIFIGEKIKSQQDLGWMSGTSATLRNTGLPINAFRRRAGIPAAQPPNMIVGGFSSYHPGGANFAFGDGHVSYLSESISETVLQQFGHRADGKLLQERD